MTLAELITKLEAAERGERELDLAITEVILWQPERDLTGSFSFSINLAKVNADPTWHKGKFADNWGVPNYTSSLDAALELVPEGFGFGVRNDSLGTGGAMCSRLTEPYSWVHAATPALALCIAALKAREGVQAP